MVDYAHEFHGFPDRSTPWPLFLAAVERMPRYQARLRLALHDSVTSGIAAGFGGSEAELGRDELVRSAFPVKRTGPAMALVQSGAKA